MAKTKKNSNYVTEKTTQAKAEREAAQIKEQKDKKVKIIAISVGSVVALIAIIVGILFATGAFEYKPEPTYHATVNFDNGDTLHIELYGNDAPETVKHFRQLCNEGYFNGRTAHSFLEDLVYIGAENADGGDKGIKGEFADNGVENKIPMKRGVVCMARGEGKNSAYGQFFVLTKNNSSLEGQYAAFGRITDLSTLNNLTGYFRITEDGNVVSSSPKITSISLHAAHD